MRLSDEEIIRIFTRLTENRGTFDGFIVSYAESICQATRKDFFILRPASMILIAKYNLGQFLENSDGGAAMPIHDFPPRRSA